jgi:acetyltransferase-like isoleucine patch superfamily enzyme
MKNTVRYLFALQNIFECVNATLRSAVLRAGLQQKNPSCRIYSGVMVDERSALGTYNVLFSNVKILSSVIGDHTYVQENATICDAEVGKFCSIAMGASIGVPQHQLSSVSSHPAFYLRNTPLAKTYSDQDMFRTFHKTFIGHDVWIGQNAIIMNGLRVGIGAVIGAGAVVTRDVPAYAVVGGVPAQIIKYRFDEKLRNDLLGSKWWDMPEEWMENNYSLFQDPLKFLEYFNAKR